jgi:hypothetical protein
MLFARISLEVGGTFWPNREAANIEGGQPVIAKTLTAKATLTQEIKLNGYYFQIGLVSDIVLRARSDARAWWTTASDSDIRKMS